ncbi:hypothetical protein K493DRAFT_325062 [Basidiobolus meristosporus CBS 931.73]|uniref:CCR4-Not complex 3'-5'-exoribonuclease subunit Ccr4 n=1 Tax=Basidiobolus meristosporus CBS 931.73 TaxID=1314790 RepID=A0A1Y1Y650_9FUNG|nr:hypothetical protein K493DRAFT_325062 [Basidiobolus meristosporus CBS 931.73]|eukprot:ORX93439.1 hypothetical protein K493DRAFT_325062 [Basidiobolus meristosporus CBS 931.73]
MVSSLPTATTAHHQHQINYLQISRQSSSSHHHARTAAALSRSTAYSNPITITDPNNPTVAINGLTKRAQDKQQNGKNGTHGHQWTVLDIGGMGLKNLSTELFSYQFLTTLYLNHNNLTFLTPEIRRLRNLTHLDISGNKLTSVPAELGFLINLKELFMFDNLLETLPPQLGTLYQLENLGLEGNPIKEPLMSILYKDGIAELIAYLRDNCPAPLPPPEREWLTFESEKSDAGEQDNNVFTILTYNILSEKYATSQQYGYTPSWALEWEYRKDLILQEILSYNPDILCLQEVEASQYEEFFCEQLKQADYDSVFWVKSRAKTMSEWERKSVDGCATFFKSSMFNILDKQIVEFTQVAMKHPDFEKTEDFFNRFMTKDNISGLALLETKDSKQQLLVANAHIHWDPTFADVKLIQVSMLMNEITRHGSEWIKSYRLGYKDISKLPILICGDFNSSPTSGVCEFLSRGSVTCDHEDLVDHNYGKFTSKGLAHKIPLRSAYSQIGELPFTNFTAHFTGVIDYIWHSTGMLSVNGLLGGLDAEYVSRNVGFPNAQNPSDHICLLAEIKFKAPQTGPTNPQFRKSSVK